MESLSGQECRALGPKLKAKTVAGLVCTSSHSVDPVTLTNKLVESALVNGARLFLGNRVTGITKVAEEFLVETINHHAQVKNYRATFIINAAGHYADFMTGIINYKDFKTGAPKRNIHVKEISVVHMYM